MQEKAQGAFEIYFNKLNALYHTERTTEYSYRSELKDLLCTLLPSVMVVHEPTHETFGAPDYILLKNDLPISFVEAKDIGDADLAGKKDNKDQFNRYKTALDTIVFTDYLDFHLWQNGNETRAVRIGEIFDDHIVGKPEAYEFFLQLIEELGDARPQKIVSANQLTKYMASKARLLKDVAEKVLAKNKNSTLMKLMNDFRRTLIPQVTIVEFADIYAQTLIYGMFAARLHDKTPDNFSRYEAAALIPKSNPFLKQFFLHLTSNLEDELEWIVDDITRLFAAANVQKIMHELRQGRPYQRPDDPFLRRFPHCL